MPERLPNRRQTVYGSLYRRRLALVVVLLALLVAGVLVYDRQRREAARREADIAATTASANALADALAKDTDSDGRFVRKPDGDRPETDAWGRAFRLSYKPHTLSDELEVRSAGPDGIWDTRDDIKAVRESPVSTKALARDAAAGLFDAAKTRLTGGKKPDDEKK